MKKFIIIMFFTCISGSFIHASLSDSSQFGKRKRIEIYSWNIEKIESTKDSNLFFYHVSNRDGYSTFRGMNRLECEYLLVRFGKKNIEEMRGVSFWTLIPELHHAMNYLMIEGLYKKKYTKEYIPPTMDDIHQKIAESFAKMKLPDFSEIDSYTLYSEMKKISEDEEYQIYWIKSLNKKIKLYTQEKINFNKAGSLESFFYSIGNYQQNVENFVLRKGEETIFLSLGGTYEPIKILK